MKNQMFKTISLATVLVTMLLFAACEKEEVSPSPDTFTTADESGNAAYRINQNAFLFPSKAKMYGKSFAEWSAEWWRWSLSFPCDANPLIDLDGSNGSAGQNGQVFFLAGTGGGEVTRDISIPSGKAVFFPIINGIAIGPCTDFEPEPGQTLEAFYQSVLVPVFDQANALSVTLDGQSFNNLQNYRATTDLFSFIGNLDLVNCIDNCITGVPQDVLSDGYWIMLKPLSPGTHTLNFSGALPQFGFSLDVTYNITVP
jgi:hypothetical protein